MFIENPLTLTQVKRGTVTEMKSKTSSAALEEEERQEAPQDCESSLEPSLLTSSTAPPPPTVHGRPLLERGSA